jgi:hypothetical protein
MHKARIIKVINNIIKEYNNNHDNHNHNHHLIQYNKTYYEMTVADKQSLISESVAVI